MADILSFDQLPEAVNQLSRKLDLIEKLLQAGQKKHVSEPIEQLLNVQEAANLLSLAVPTVYSKVSRGELPVMKRTKRLYFSRNELMSYLKEGRKRSTSDIYAEANKYLQNK